MKPLVYLAGPINGQTFEEAVAWREEAARVLEPSNIQCLSPLRGMEPLKQHLSLSGGQFHAFVVPEYAMSTQQAVLTMDRDDVRRSSLVLMNLLPASKTGVVSIGTAVELGWADAFRKPVVLVMEKGNLHDHLFTRGLAGWQVETLDEAFDVIRIVLGSR